LAAIGLAEVVDICQLELMDPVSIDAFAEKFLASGRRLDILINNAGVMCCPLARDSRGFESQLSTNHFGHFQVTIRLLPALKKARGARVVTLSSRRHMESPFVFEDWNFERRAYDPLKSYGQSKTANALFAVLLDEKCKGSGIRAFSVHPGIVASTDLLRWTPKEELIQAGFLLNAAGEPILDPKRQLKTIPQGAATTVWVATSRFLDGKGGLYCENCNIAPTMEALARVGGAWDADGFAGVARYAVERENALRLWELTAKTLGIDIE
jgi:NAD(P)-dependent dehydrogenase (short-subunit alcohol dehydrogenase family)